MASLTLQQALSLALQHHQARQLPQAEQLYRQVLQHDPNNTDALALLGALLGERQQYALAIELISRAIALNPRLAQYQLYLAEVLQKSGQSDQAEQACRRAIELDAASSDAQTQLGNLLYLRGRLEDAILCYQHAIQLDPHNASACAGLGRIAEMQGRFEEALQLAQRVVEISPSDVDARGRLGLILHKLHRIDEAITCYRQVLATHPNHPAAWSNLGNACRDLGRLDEAIECFRNSVQLCPGDALLHSNLLYALHFQAGLSPQAILDEHRRWAASLPRFTMPAHANDHASERRLRVAYLGPYFRRHVVGQNFAPVLARHDRSQFEITLYSSTLAEDDLTARMRSQADRWLNVSSLSDEQLAQRIREDGIDILVDMAGHMEGNRIALFARRPAPVQISHWGYPATTGLAAIDYRISDSHLDPPGQSDSHSAEKILRLPHSFWCYRPDSDQPPVAPLPALARGSVTFGSLNAPCKASPQAIALWAQTLHRVSNSRMMLLVPLGHDAGRYFIEQFSLHSIAPDRLELVPRCSRTDYLHLYGQIDIGLDPFPYTGHSTSCDAFWMGVPVITLPGQTSVSRAGVSLLNNLGLPELIAATPADYVEIAARLAGDLPRLQALRQSLRRRMQASPLMDADAYTRDLESLYRQAWRAYCQSA